MKPLSVTILQKHRAQGLLRRLESLRDDQERLAQRVCRLEGNDQPERRRHQHPVRHERRERRFHLAQ